MIWYKTEDECLYCGEKESIDIFVKTFANNNIIDWLTATNKSKGTPTIKEKLFSWYHIWPINEKQNTVKSLHNSHLADRGK